MPQIVTGIRQNKCGVIVTRSALSDSNVGGLLRCLYLGYAAGESYKVLAELISPGAQCAGVIPVGIGGHKNDLELRCHILGEFLERGA